MINASNISTHCVARVDTVNKCVITVALPSFYFFTRLMSGSRLGLNVANLVHSPPLLAFSAHFCQQKPGLSLTPARWIVLVEICPLQFHHGEIRRGNITDQFTYTVVGLRQPPLPLRSPSLSDSYCLESGWQDWCGSVNQEWARVALSPSHIYHPQNGD